MKNRITFVFLLACTITFGQINLTPAQIVKLDSIATQDVPEGAPGIATAIISDGVLIYQKYAGFENLRDSTMIAPSSRFNLASNGKQFTALAILLLEEQGKLSLTDDIRKYLPEVFQKQAGKITIQNLLNHTSGIRDVYDLWSLQGITWWKQTYDNDDVLQLIEAQQDLNFQPGSQFLYSNTNYILLAEIITRVSKKSFSDFTKEMFAKLNMNDSSFENDYTAIKEPIAKAYFNFETWSTYDWKWNVVGDGNFFSTMADQIIWEKILQGYVNPKISNAVLHRSQQLDSTGNTFYYSNGLQFGKHKGLPYRFHEGTTGAWKATVIRFNKPNLAIVTMTNSGKTIPAVQTRQMADVIFDLKAASAYFETQPKTTGTFVREDDLLGIYLTPENFSFNFKKKENGSLVLDRIGRGETEIVREADNIFHQKYDPAFKQEFAKNEKGEMTVTAYHPSHPPYSLTRVEANWNEFDFKNINGSFINTETNVVLTITHKANKNYRVILNGQERNGILVSPNKMLVNNYVIAFNTQAKKVKSLALSADRIKNILFRRNESSAQQGK